MFRTLLCDESNQFLVVEDASAISDIVEHKGRHLWLDLEQPSMADMQMIQEEFGLHPLAIEDAMSRHQRPKVDQYDNFYFVVFYAVTTTNPADTAEPAIAEGSRSAQFLRAGYVDGITQPAAGSPEATRPGEGFAGGEGHIVLRELTMFLGQNYLITVHRDPLAELDEVARRWRRNVEALVTDGNGAGHLAGTRPLTPEEQGHLSRTGDGKDQHLLLPPEQAEKGRATSPPQRSDPATAPFSPLGDAQVDIGDRRGTQRSHENDIGILLYSLLDTIVDAYFPVVDSIVERVEDLEEQVFQRFNQSAIESIFALKKDLLALRKVLAPERDVLNVLVRRDLPIFKEHTLVYFQDIYDHVVRITDSIDTYRDLLSSALDSFLSVQSNRLNITVQTLTSVSIMLMSLAAVTGWYGMNFAAMPELNSRFGYPGVTAAVIVILVVEYLFFKRKRWL